MAVDYCQECHILALPTELLLTIFSFFEAGELMAVASVCTTIAELSKDDQLWRNLCIQRWKGKKFVGLAKTEKPKIIAIKKRVACHVKSSLNKNKTLKTVYLAQELDACRTRIMPQELQSIDWYASLTQDV
jgi:F-box-like